MALALGLGLGLSAAVAQETAPPQTTPQPRPTLTAPALPDQSSAEAVTAPAPAEVPAEPAATPATIVAAPGVGPVTGFALPRYVSMKAAEANARRGPSRTHRIDWVFQRRNMPMMVVAEHGHWRRVVDRDGAGGWMHYSLLSGVRTAIVEDDLLAMRQRPAPDAQIRAEAEQGVIVWLEECDGSWCRISTGGQWGWVPIAALWGVEAGETFR